MSLGLMMAVNAEVVEVYRRLWIDLPRFQGREGWFLPIPATYVVDRDRRIKAAFVNPDFRKRMTIEQIEAALRA
jgi:peroxiredoxin